MEEYLLEKLTEYAGTDFYPLHMPGHKRQIKLLEDPYAIDITEIEGFDDLHHAGGILLEAEKRAAALYGADFSWYLINGSTCGILAAVAASVPKGGRIVMARNSHKSAYHAAFLNGLRVDYLYPEVDPKRGICGSISPESVKRALADGKKERAAAVLITSPTYDGVVSDIRSIADAAHEAGAVLIVDEAHGAHFAMHPYFPEPALDCGADIVVNSLHKTLPSLTQTALLHVKGTRADRERIDKYLDMYQSSSPSYVLMAGMDACIRLMDTEGEELFAQFVERLESLRASLFGMQHLHLVTGKEPELNAFAYDPSRLLISTEQSSLDGPKLKKLLRERYHLEPEMASERYVTALLSVADTREGFERLREALLEIDGGLKPAEDGVRPQIRQPRPREVMTMEEADRCPKRTVPLTESVGSISSEFVYLYPPGTPFLVPGERIPEEFPGLITRFKSLGLSIRGMSDHTAETILCCTSGRK